MSQAAHRRVEVSRRQGVATIAMVRAERMNAIDLRMTEELRDAARSLEGDTSVRVVVLTGSGGSFSVGGDLEEFVAEKDRLREHLLAMTAAFHAAILSLHCASAPLIVAVNGVAAGGGFSLVTGGDLVVAKRSAKLAPAYTKSGLTPDGGGTWFLPRIVGRMRAFELFATNPVLGAEEAQALGIVSRVVDDEAFDAAVDASADAIAALAPSAASGLKRLLGQSEHGALEAHLARESESISNLATTPETMARLMAFVSR